MADTKIVMAGGQEFSVPVGTDNEQVRQQLAGMFPDVAAATIQTGKRTIDGIEYATVEFVKKAGTKGLTPRALAHHLLRVLPTGVAAAPVKPRIEQLTNDRLTFAEVVTHDVAGPLGTDLDTIVSQSRPSQQEGHALCDTLAPLTAVASAALPSGW